MTALNELLKSRTSKFIQNTLASYGIHWAMTRQDSFLTSGESFLLSIMCLCFLELSTDIREIIKELKEK